MSKIIEVSGALFHLQGNDIDTDRIIPARYLKCVTFEGLGEHIFEDDRLQAKGTHPFDNPANKGATILLVDDNFGCGSSREHAPQALMRWGIKALIGKSFANIFRGNCTANGIVCADIAGEIHEGLVKILDGSPYPTLCTIDLLDCWFSVGGTFRAPFSMPAADREMLVRGTWDTIATLLEAGDLIDQAEERLTYA